MAVPKGTRTTDTCKGCSSKFTPTKKGNTFCTQRCWRRWRWRTHEKMKPLTQKPCFVCQGLFQPTAPWNRYCSIRCREKQRRIISTKRDGRSPDSRPSRSPFGKKKCSTCNTSFLKTRAVQKFCSDRCRQLSRSRRWRNKNIKNKKCRACPLPLMRHSGCWCEKHWLTQLAWRCGLRGKNSAGRLKSLLVSQKRRCVYTGRKLVLGLNASIDHKVARSVNREKVGDIKNMEWVELEVNRAKRTLSKKRFVGLCKLIASRF